MARAGVRLHEEPALAEPENNPSDYSAAGITYASDNGEMLSLPWSVDYFMVYWNKELFQKKGIAYPDEFRRDDEGGEALTDPKEGVYGFVGRGLRNANLPLYMSFLLGYGGDALDSKGNLTTDSPEAIEAAKYYQRILTKCAPPGVAGFNWMECQSVFLQGKAAMWLDGVGWAGRRGPDAFSRVVGKIGYSPVPRGRLRRLPRHLATVSASPPPARTKRPSSIANGRSASSWAAACCKPAAACHSAIPFWTTRTCRPA